MHHGDMIAELVHRVGEDGVPPVHIVRAQKVHGVEDDAQIRALHGLDDLQRPVGVIDDMAAHGLNGHHDAELLRHLQHRLQIPHEGAQRLPRVGVAVELVGGIRRARLRPHHADAGEGRQPQHP